MMRVPRVIGLVLIAGGVLGLVYGAFTYTSESHDVDLGVVEVSINDQDTVTVPVWASVSGIAIGAVLLLVRTPA